MSLTLVKLKNFLLKKSRVVSKDLLAGAETADGAVGRAVSLVGPAGMVGLMVLRNI